MRGQSGRLAGWLAVVVTVMFASAAWAVEPDEILPDARLEARARALSLDLRCLVCQNQSIDDSNAPLAKDLRLLVRERLKAGDSDSDVMKFIVARYGDFVLLKPPLNWKTLLLWLSAPALLLGVGVMLWRTMPAGAGGPIGRKAAPLSRDEEERVRRLLAEADKDRGGS